MFIGLGVEVDRFDMVDVCIYVMVDVWVLDVYEDV